MTMASTVQVAAFESGSLRLLASGKPSREAVLALPLSRLLVRLVRVPAESREDPCGFAAPLLRAMSPYPDEPLTVSCELVREAADGAVVVAAALPESAADDIAEALDAAKLNVTRVDALALGAVRGLWSAIGGGDERRLLLMKGADCISLLIIDGDAPSAIRAVSAASDLRREVMLSLLEAEDFGGVKSLSEIIVTGDFSADGLEDLAPIRRVEIGEDAALVGVAERSADANALNALPESWRQVLDESRLKKKLTRGLAVAGGVWLLVMGILFGVPMGYGFMTDRQKSLSKEHRRAYAAVKDMRDKETGAGEIALAKERPCRLVFGAETGESGEGNFVSYFEEGKAHLRGELAKALDALRREDLPAGYGVAIHHLGSWVDLKE